MDIEDKQLIQITRELVLEGFEPSYGRLTEEFPSRPMWQRMRELGSELWLDTGDIGAVAALWTGEFGALTTNNTLLNKEVQKGTYDGLIRRSVEALRGEFPQMESRFMVREIAFVLNAYHALRLVERFDAFVSVEEHTDLANDLGGAIAYARRYYAICPRRFFVKIPLTAAGLLAAREAGQEGIPVNLTLGFSARQNVLVIVIAQPRYCNVFLGRLNQVVAENKLGDGNGVGEKAVTASQRAVRAVPAGDGAVTKQIGASLRSGEQVRDLAGVDVLTIPPGAAEGFLKLRMRPERLEGGLKDFQPKWASGVKASEWGLNSLWRVPKGLEGTARDIAARHGLDPEKLLELLAGAGFGDILPRWSESQVEMAAADGKIPKLARWRELLRKGEIGLDALMNLHGLQSFAADQEAMDERIRTFIPVL